MLDEKRFLFMPSIGEISLKEQYFLARYYPFPM